MATYNDTRLLGSTFEGGLLTSQEIDGLTLNAGRLTKANLRDSSSNDDIGYAAASSDHFDFGGGSYAFSPQLNVSYYYGKLEQIYRQQFVGLVHTQPLGNGFNLRSDLRYFDSRGDGAEKADPTTTATSIASYPFTRVPTRSVPPTSSCPATAPFRSSTAAIRTWSTW